MTSRLGRRRDQPKRSRRNVARYRKISRLGNLIAEDCDSAILIDHRANKKIIEHQLRVVSRRHGLLNGGLSLRKKPCEEQGAFDLRTGNW